MTTVTDLINEPRSVATWTAARNWAQPAPASAEPVARNAKGERSIAPQNTVALTWQDALDTINPLQQLPVVGEIYRGVTGDTISGVARVAGGFLFGGIAGGLVAALTAAFAEAHDGKGPGEQLVAALAGTDQPDAAKATPATTTPAVPTVTLTAKEDGQQQAATTMSAAAPATATAPVNAEQTLAENAATPAIPGMFLRDRLNQKRPAGMGSAPAGATSFIDRLPAAAATLSANQAQNLDLLQGIVNVPASSNPLGLSPTPAALAAASETAGQRRNPLPANLVRDMMLQGLEKYDRLPPVAPVETATE